MKHVLWNEFLWFYNTWNKAKRIIKSICEKLFKVLQKYSRIGVQYYHFRYAEPFFSTYTDTGTGSLGSNSGCEDHFYQSDYFDGELKYVHSAFKTHHIIVSWSLINIKHI